MIIMGENSLHKRVKSMRIFYQSLSLFFLIFISNINTTNKQCLIHNYKHTYIYKRKQKKKKKKKKKTTYIFFHKFWFSYLREQERERVDRQKKQQQFINFSIIKRL